jgi:histidine triad (HIT) family protein
VSQSVSHLHIDVVPRRKNDGLRGFFWPRERYKDKEEMLAVQRLLQTAIGQLRAAGD